MNDDELIGERLQRELPQVEAAPHRLEEVVRRARWLRVRRLTVAGVVSALAIAGVATPLVLLSPINHRISVPPVGTPSGGLPPSGSLTGPSPLTQGTANWDRQDGIWILTPPGWSFLQGPSGPLSPPTIFAIANYPIMEGGTCAPDRAIDALPSSGTIAWVFEYPSGPGAALPPKISDFPPRPARFSLSPSSLAHYECTTRASYMFRFSDQGRFFQVHVIFGNRATPAVRQAMMASLSSLVVDRCPPALSPGPVSQFGTLVPDHGRPGDRVSISGPTGRDENWFWSPLQKIEVWWSNPRIPGAADMQLLASIDPGHTCSFTVTFRVPNVVPGNYLITILAYYADGSGFGVDGERRFSVTP